MITVRRSGERGVGRHGWLTTHHTFSFANYYDPRHMGFRTLRVINEDRVEAGRGFGAHRHEDMEIISIVTDGALAHRDSTGGEGVLRRGEVQRMSAGSGVVHSEFNGSDTDAVNFFQIWIEPDEYGLAPGYEQKDFPYEERQDRLRLLASPDAAEGALKIHQDARVYSAVLSPGSSVEHPLGSGRGAWVQVVTGAVSVNGKSLGQGDGAALEEESLVRLTAGETGGEILLFDLG